MKLKRFEAAIVEAVIKKQLELKYTESAAIALVLVAKGNPNPIASLIAQTGLMVKPEMIFSETATMPDGVTLLAGKFDVLKGVVYAYDKEKNGFLIDLDEWMNCSVGEDMEEIDIIGYHGKPQQSSNILANKEFPNGIIPKFGQNKEKDKVKQYNPNDEAFKGLNGTKDLDAEFIAKQEGLTRGKEFVQ